MTIKKVLVYNGKHDIEIWDVSTPELAEKAYLDLFNVLDESWRVYDELKEIEEPSNPSMNLEQIAQLPSGRVKDTAQEEHRSYQSELKQYKLALHQKQLYKKAKAGDAKSAHLLLSTRNDYEYKGWRIMNVNEVE